MGPSPSILAISGSLRRGSVNTAAIRAVARAGAAQGIVVTISDAVRHLPHFDPDREEAPPEPVLGFRAACARASGVLLAVPEYAHGIPGAFKNAIDWAVGDVCLNYKPVAVLDVAAPGRGSHVRRALDDVLAALGTQVTHYEVPVGRGERGGDGEIHGAEALAALSAVVVDFAARVRVVSLSAGTEPELQLPGLGRSLRERNGDRPDHAVPAA
jgi:NAD(P)H-dependent FMN reductase